MVTDRSLGRRILVIDDEESVREGCRQALDESGYQTDVARSGLQGLRIVEEARPDMVLVDLKMPDMHGLELLKKIRSEQV